MFRLSFLAACMAVAIAAEAQTVYKVDINEFSRTKDEEVLEPGFTRWQFPKDCNEATLTVDDATFTIRSEHNMRGGWNKVFVQNVQFNCRLTGDGVNLDPNECGQFDLVIKGLTPGTHTIQTFHNSWADPANNVAWPVTLKLNGTEVGHAAVRTMQEASIQDATVFVTTFTVSSQDEEVVFTISTSDDDAPADMGGKTGKDMTPVLNGFMIDAIQSSQQAKRPNPADADMHVDADNGTYLITWEAANEDVARHQFYFATDAAALEAATTPTYEGTETSWQATGLKNLETYYWRVDEVAANGTVTRGETWSFRPRHLAFPGAEGYGRYANGGRGGVVYHVTNLSDDRQPGSFRYGIESLTGPRTIVFDVSGLIHLGGKLQSAGSTVTIAGQTAPGKGICFSGAAIGFSDDHIIRHIRNRVGSGETYDGMGFRGAHESIMDHCSISWSIDEGFSSREAGNITLQRTLISEALNVADHDKYDEGSRHGFAAVFGGDIGSFHHNLLANNSGRNPRLDGGMDGNNYYTGRLDIFNNVVYNWNSHPAYGESHEANFHRNFYKMGPATGRKWILRADVNQRGSNRGTESYYYMYNVLVDKTDKVIFDGTKHGDGSTTDVDGGLWQLVNPMTVDWNPWVDEPFYPSFATVQTAYEAYKDVLSDVGCTQPAFDDHDQRQVHETLTGTNKYTGSKTGLAGLPDTEEDVGGYEVYPEEQRAANWDTDQDGMPDWWERLVGSDASAANHNDDPDGDGYTLLEDYLNFMAEPHLVLKTGETQTLSLATLFAGYTKQPQYSIENSDGKVQASIADGVLTVNVPVDNQGRYSLTLKVSDSEAATCQRTLNIAAMADDDAAAIHALHTEQQTVTHYEVYTIGGKLLTSGSSAGTRVDRLPLGALPHGVYVLKAIDTSNCERSYKIAK